MQQKIKLHCATETDLLSCGIALAKVIDHEAVIFLYGPLGAGKTTFCRGFLRGLGYEGKVKSPTYTLVEPYEIAGKTIYHFDFYRMTDASELHHSGIEDYFASPAICLVEWPEVGLSLLPSPDIVCYLAFAKEGRDLVFEARSLRGEKIITQLKVSN